MTMKNRWKMNRMGFVNFWLYDEEIFEFCDGKILLRGQNGAGKGGAESSVFFGGFRNGSFISLKI